ncbi:MULTISPECIES: PepSY-associated TM helix domain-containing protein [unclassified Pseudoalteromonas]|uniref:PepSY-associated TM helix domain-containing protein n=1 Tax=unclassified Pseudoalteromonas TaxID=194690 RepID=UPI00301493C3
MSNKTQQRKFLKKLYHLHAWVGFQLALVMFVILVTGTIATLSNEIDWLVHEPMRSSTPSEKNHSLQAQDWRAMYEAIKAQYPDSKVLTLGSMGEDYFNYRARVTNAQGLGRYVYVDPWTHEVTGETSLLTVQRVFRDLHRYLFMPAFPGLPIVTAFAFILLISLYTGLKTTRNWKTALWRIRTQQGVRILLSDLHKVFGLWGLWCTSVIIITSFWYLFEFGVRVSGSSLEPSAPSVSAVVTQNSPSRFSGSQLEQGFIQAQQSIENWTITAVQFPRDETSVLRFKGVGENPLLRERAHKVDFHPYTLERLNVQHPGNMTMGNYLNEYADPLHFGYFAGLTSKLIWFVFGVALTGLSFTGVLMTWKRTKSARLTRAQVATLPIFVLSAFYFVFWIQRYL